MVDTVTVTRQVHGKPDVRDLGKSIITPQTVRLIYRLDSPGPINGIYPVRAEVTGPARSAQTNKPHSDGIRHLTEFFDRDQPQHWPTWLIQLGAEHRPQQHHA
ncbi:hypothetical protein [Streptomyces albipurpureus]|uniref:Uncharacterized protein n=1 Tax=Streptomyces albipurpureus TaxID=2897419 RepID=A0ABT0US95_9ACTN|nr:hypothetical protein [Streptomyces sp. CWNU-1]MCM2391319.1 hypothetical protein [Streptomyces sp. CWNU-1]